MSEHVLDLGDELKIKVKYAGQEYTLREPTVGEIDSFKESSADVNAVAELLSTLGMPKEVVLKMPMSKATALVNGLTDLLTKKK